MGKLSMTQQVTKPKVDLDSLVRRQRGVVTRTQVFASGADDDLIRHRLRAERWQRVLPGLYATFTGELTLEQRRIAATQYARRCQITGIAALVWHGFRHLPLDDRIHVLVPHSVRRTSRGFVQVQRTMHPDRAARLTDGYHVCSVARAVADACRQLSDLNEVRAIVAEAVQRGRTTVDALEIELGQAGNSRTRLFRRALSEVARGARSAPEAQLQRLCASSDILPAPLWNPVLTGPDGTRLPSPDGWIDDVAVAIEVDSREYHLSPEDWRRTMRRHNLLSAHGALVLHFTPSEIRGRRRHVLNLIEQAYRERTRVGARSAVRVVAPPPPQ